MDYDSFPNEIECLKVKNERQEQYVFTCVGKIGLHTSAKIVTWKWFHS